MSLTSREIIRVEEAHALAADMEVRTSSWPLEAWSHSWYSPEVQAVAYFECDVLQSEGVRAVFEECVELVLALADHDQTRAHSGSRIGGKRTDDEEPTGCFPFLARQTSGSPAARRRANTVRTTQLSVDVKGVLAPVAGGEVSSLPSPTPKEWNARWLERERKRLRRGHDACFYQSHQLADHHRLGGKPDFRTDTNEGKGKEKVEHEERSERTRSKEERRQESSTDGLLADEPSGGNVVVRPREPQLRKKRSLRRLLAAVSLRQLKPDPTPPDESSAPPSLSGPPTSLPGKKVGWTHVRDEADARLGSG
jgi:hypothetical protein